MSVEQSSGDELVTILQRAYEKGVRVWSENGRLHYKAPKDALTKGEMAELQAHSSAIKALLDRAVGAEAIEPSHQPRAGHNRVPLTFAQLAHWNLYRLSERRSARHVASATRLRGRLNVDLLQESVLKVVRRHEALRTRIVVSEGVPEQEIAESCDCRFEVDDLTMLPDDQREKEARQRISICTFEPIDVTVDPLFAVRLLRLSDDEHILIVAMEHMISDGRSMGILLRDLFAMYTQAVGGVALPLPPVPVQLSDYAVWQRSSQVRWIEEHRSYWNTHLTGFPGLRFPAEQQLPADARTGSGVVRFLINRKLKSDLREWCRARRTTLVMSALTAYVGLVMRWCDVSDVVIRYQTDGRFGADTENSIGYFAFPLYLRLESLRDESFVDLLKRVSEEYCRAHAYADYSYMEAQVPRPEFTKSTRFNWLVYNESTEFSELDGSENAVTCSRVYSERRIVESFSMDDDPAIGLGETDVEIRGSLAFPLNRFSFDAMERFAASFLSVLTALVNRPDSSVRDINLP